MAANFGCIRNAVGYNDWHQILGNARPIDGRPQNEVQVEPDKLEVVASFCYLGDMLSAGGGCEITVTSPVKTAWKKFRELLQFSHPATSQTRHVAMYTALVCRAPCSMPVKLGHWPRRTCSACNDRAMITDQTDQLYQARGRGQGKVKRATGKAWGPQPHFASLVWACGAI